MDLRKVIPIGLAAFFVLGAAAASAEGADNDARALFETKCSTCHNIDRPKSKTKTPDKWRKTVLRMQGKKNSGITADEAEKIADYLAKTYPKK